jgi:hypothetical protein
MIELPTFSGIKQPAYGVAVSRDGKDWEFLPEVWHDKGDAERSAEHWLEGQGSDLAEIVIFKAKEG